MNEIKHKAVVRKNEAGKTEVEILDGMECEACSIKGACNVGDIRDKVFNVDTGTAQYESGEEITINMSQGMAFSALFWAYIFPFIVLFLSLIVLSIFFSEGIAGLFSLLFLAVYYLFVFLNKKYFETKFRLKINKIKND